MKGEITMDSAVNGKTKVLVCDPLHEEGIRKIKEKGFEVDVKPIISKEELERIVSDYDVLIVRSRTNITGEIIKRAKHLKIIGRAGAGLDNIDVKSAEEANITVLNTAESAATSVAELTIGLILSLVRRIPEADRSMKEAKWIKKDLEGRQLRGKTLGLIGFGNIGIKVAQIASGFGMVILIAKRTPPDRRLLESIGARWVSLPVLLSESDIVSLHVPLTEQTRNMIGARELDLMKDGAFLVNTSRGAIIDEDALLEALQSGKLGGVALDVYESEPPTDLGLIRLPNVVCTPHIGAQTEEAQRDAAVGIAEKIINLLTKTKLTS